MKTKEKISSLVSQNTHSLEQLHLSKTIYFQIELPHFLGTWLPLRLTSSVLYSYHLPFQSCWTVSTARVGMEHHTNLVTEDLVHDTGSRVSNWGARQIWHCRMLMIFWVGPTHCRCVHYILRIVLWVDSLPSNLCMETLRLKVWCFA